MSLAYPQNLDEWAQYIVSLKGHPLWSKASAANSMRFVNALLEDGFSMPELDQIFLLFARQFRDTKQQPPGEGIYDLIGLVSSPKLDLLPKLNPLPIPDEPDEIDRGFAELDTGI